MKLENYCFVDGVNLYKGVENLGWHFSNGKLYKYLREKYKCEKVYYHIGYVANREGLYTNLQEAGFILEFKPTIPDDRGKPKGNIDADLVLKVMQTLDEFKKAVIVSGDGDYYRLVKFLYKNKRLEKVLAPNKTECSGLLEQEAKEKIDYMNGLRNKIEFKDS